MLAARDVQKLQTAAAGLRKRGAAVETFAADFVPIDAEQALGTMVSQLGGVDVILLAYGVLGDHNLAEKNAIEAHRIFTVNFTSAAHWCLAATNVLEEQGHGTLIVIGSVAGDRGRGSNYIYGASKAGLGVLVQGIAHRLARTRARAVLIKAGFIDTPMTAATSSKGVLWTRPDNVARVIIETARTPRRPILYAPSFWRWIMYPVRFMPSVFFHRTNL
jgi:NAD(P)-dependent dehydrogenase (short-subunit alcohol dehydrogenase family)